MIKSLVAYEGEDSATASAALKKIRNHLWYLSDVSMGFAIFDSSLADCEREAIVDAMRTTPSDQDQAKHRALTDDVRSLSKASLFDFASTRTLR